MGSLPTEAQVFVQALMARGALPETDARELYKRVHSRADGG